MKIYVLPGSDDSAQKFQKINEGCRFPITFLKEVHTYAEAADQVIAQGELALLVHDDILLPPSFCDHVEALCRKLDDTYECWGLASNTGIACYGYKTTEKHVSFIHRKVSVALNTPKGIYPAQSLDGNVLLINAPVLKQKQISCSKHDGTGVFYDFVISLECIKKQCAVLISHDLLVHSYSDPLIASGKTKRSTEFKKYLTENLKDTTVNTVYGDITFTRDTEHKNDKIDLQQAALKAAVRKDLPQVAIVVRTQFKRPKIFAERCIGSIKSFIACSMSDDIFKAYVVSDRPMPDELKDLYAGCEFIHAESCMQKDTRFELIYHALHRIAADYMLFIDDDDFIFPNQAELLKDAVCAFENDKTFYFDTQFFKERLGDTNILPEGTPIHKLKADDYLKSRFGINCNPFCGVLFPVELLRSLVEKKLTEKISYAEDYSIQLLMQSHRDFSPITLNALIAGSCAWSDTEQTVMLKDRTNWDRNFAEIASLVLDNSNFFFAYTKDLPETLEKKGSAKNYIKAHLPILSKVAHGLRDTLRAIKHIAR